MQAILESYSVNSADDIVRFSRWTRTVLSIVLHRAGKEDEERAMAFIVQAREVLKSPVGKKVNHADQSTDRR